MRTRLLKVDPDRPDPAVIKEAAGLLRRGGLVAFPTETVYGLGANLEDPQAMQELYQVKQRPFEKQVTLHLAEGRQVRHHEVEVPPLAQALMDRFWPGPMTLILPRRTGGALGFRVPRHLVAHALLCEAAVPVVAPSANLSGQPPARRAEEILRDFSDRIDAILDGGPASLGVSSTVVEWTPQGARILREGPLAEEIRRLIQEFSG